MSLILLAAVVLAAAEPAATETASPPTPLAGVTVKAKPAKPDKVCWDEKPTGSHFPTRVCVSREEFDQRQRADQQAVSSGRRVGAKGAFGPN